MLRIFWEKAEKFYTENLGKKDFTVLEEDVKWKIRCFLTEN